MTAVLIVDPALHSLGGHHFNAISKLQMELVKRRLEYRTLGSLHASRDVIEGLGVVPTFSYSVYARESWTRFEFDQAVRATVRQLSKAQRWRWPRLDLLIMPCCDQVLAMAVARYLKAYPWRRIRHVLMWLMYAPNYRKAEDDPETAGLAEEYSQAMAELIAAIGDPQKLTVYCETDGMADVYRKLTGLTIDVVPGPNLVNRSERPQRTLEEGHLTVVCIGQANAPKGYRLLPDALKRVLARRGDVKFLIHGTTAGTDARDNASVFRELIELGPPVKVNTSVLDQHEYRNWLQQADLVLLPYDPAVYRSRGSGVFTEATTLGIPTIVPRGCGFAQGAIADRRAVEIITHDSTGVADAILRAVDQFAFLKERADRFVGTLDFDGRLQKLLGRLFDAG